MPANSCLKNNNYTATSGADEGGRGGAGVAAATVVEGVAIYLNLPFNLSRCLGLNFFSLLESGHPAEPCVLFFSAGGHALLLLQQKSINYLSLKLSATCHYVIVYSLPGGHEGKCRKSEKTSPGLPRLYQYSIEMGDADWDGGCWMVAFLGGIGPGH